LSLTATCSIGCNVFDAKLLDDRQGSDASQLPMDGGDPPADANLPPGDARPPPACTDATRTTEICNGADDDCDGEVDEDTQAYCEELLPNSDAVCGTIGRCLNLGCKDGFISCDGDPADGCEPICSCRPCDDAGSDDAG